MGDHWVISNWIRQKGLASSHHNKTVDKNFVGFKFQPLPACFLSSARDDCLSDWAITEVRFELNHQICVPSLRSIRESQNLVNFNCMSFTCERDDWLSDRAITDQNLRSDSDWNIEINWQLLYSALAAFIDLFMGLDQRAWLAVWLSCSCPKLKSGCVVTSWSRLNYLWYPQISTKIEVSCSAKVW